MLNVHSIFTSISGEVGYIPQGAMCTFVRLQGCSLHCPFCDSTEACSFTETSILSIFEIIEECNSRNNCNVIITGGEPLEQPNEVGTLIKELSNDFVVQVETNGVHLLPEVEDKDYITFVVDRKMFLNQFIQTGYDFYLKFASTLCRYDYVKFIVQDKEEMKQAIDEIKTYWLTSNPMSPVQLAISPVLNKDNIPQVEYSYIMDCLSYHDLCDSVIINSQLHKFLDLP